MRLFHALILASLIGVSQEAYQVPLDAMPMEEVPEDYRAWHLAAQTCAAELGGGNVKDFAEIEWWSVPGESFGLYGGEGFAGYFDARPSPPRIYIVDAFHYSESLIRHESLHHALDPVDGHPQPPFDFCETP